MPEVSVMIPFFNAEIFINKCLQSALTQEGVDLEVILVDDASTDNTVRLVEALKDPRIRILRNKRNMGEFFSRNRVIDEARGQWIAILDADDEWLPGRLSRLLAYAKVGKADLVADNLIIREAKSGKTYEAFGRKMLSDLGYLTPEVFIRNDRPYGRISFGHMKPLLRLDFVRSHSLRYPRVGSIAGDFTFCLECLLEGGKYVVHPEAGYIYNIHSNSVTADPRRRAWLDLIPHVEHTVSLVADLGREDLLAELKERGEKFRRYVDYQEFVSPLKQGNVKEAFDTLRSKPHIAPDALWYLSVALKRRVFGPIGPMHLSQIQS